MIAYVDSAEATQDTALTTLSVAIPATAAANHLAVLSFVCGDTGLTHTLGATGWTEHINADGGGTSTLHVKVWSKLLVAGDLGTSPTVTSTNPGVSKRTLDIGIYSGAQMGQILHAFETVSVSLHTAPTVTTVDANAWIVQFVADRGNPGSVAFNPPASVVQRQAFAHAGAAAVTSVLVDDDLVGAGVRGGGTYQGTIATQNACLVTMALEPNNNLLTANAGPDRSAGVNTNVVLSGSATGGSASYTYSWTQTAGTPTVTINNATLATANFTAPAAATVLTFQLQVNDGVTTATDTVVITITSLVRWTAAGNAWVARTRRYAKTTWLP